MDGEGGDHSLLVSAVVYLFFSWDVSDSGVRLGEMKGGDRFSLVSSRRDQVLVSGNSGHLNEWEGDV